MVNDPITLLNRLKISSPLANPRRQRHAALHVIRAAATNLSDVAYWPSTDLAKCLLDGRYWG